MKFTIRVTNTWQTRQEITVEANSEEQAVALAEDKAYAENISQNLSLDLIDQKSIKIQ